MGSPVRYPYGVNNVSPHKIFNDLTIPDISGLHWFYEDFDKYTAAEWVVGGVNPVVAALAAGDGGILSMATTGAANDSNFIQQAATAWTLAAGKQLWFKAIAQVDNASLAAMAFGLQVAVAANNFLTPTDGVFLRKAAAGTSVVLVSRVGSVETVTASLGNIADATKFDVEFYYDGKGSIWAGIGGNMTQVAVPAAITAVPLRITAGVLGSTAAARTMLLDQLYCVKER